MLELSQILAFAIFTALFIAIVVGEAYFFPLTFTGY